jgi:hypothetical protein
MTGRVLEWQQIQGGDEVSERAERRRKAREEAKRTRTNQTGDVTRTDNLDGTATVSFSGSKGDEVNEAIEQQLEAFRKRFGREPRGEDPLFFDPDAPGDEPQPMKMASYESEVVAVMQQVGIPAAQVYAYQQTGLLVTEENWSLLSDEDMEEWNDAVARYEALHSGDA